MRHHRAAVVLAFLAACLVVAGLWAFLRPVTFDWTGQATARGKRASLRVTRVMLEPWCYVDESAPSMRGILAHRRFRYSPKQFFLYTEYWVQPDAASADEVAAVYELNVRYAGRDLGRIAPAAAGVTVVWSEGDTQCELTSPVQPQRHLFRWPTLEVSQAIDFRDGSKEELTASLGSDRRAPAASLPR